MFVTTHAAINSDICFHAKLFRHISKPINKLSSDLKFPNWSLRHLFNDMNVFRWRCRLDYLPKNTNLSVFDLFTFDRVACVEATFAQYYPVLSESQIKLWVIEI